MSDNFSLILDSIFYRVPNLSILEGAYLKVVPGTVCALFGRNGAGKSTLLKVAAGQIHSESGITIIDGQRIYNRSINKRFSKIGYLPQNSMLPNNMSVNRLIRSFSSSNDLFKIPLIKKIFPQKIHELSGGERRYLEVTLLLCLDRNYFLLDEPFTGVEPLIIEQLIEKIKSEVDRGKGILITDHYHQYVLEMADYAYLMLNKQCYKLGNDFKSELKRLGYIRQHNKHR